MPLRRIWTIVVDVIVIVIGCIVLAIHPNKKNVQMNDSIPPTLPNGRRQAPKKVCLLPFLKIRPIMSVEPP